MQERDYLSTDITIIKSELLYLRKDVNKMLDLLIENPEHSIAPRVKILENDTIQFGKTLSQMEERGWQLRLALVASFLGFVASVIVVILEVFVKK